MTKISISLKSDFGHS